MNSEYTQILKKNVDKVVWWVPFKKLRDLLRYFFYNIIDVAEIYSITKKINKDQFDLNNEYGKLLKSEFIELSQSLDKKIQFLLEKENPKLKSENGIIIIKISGGLADQIFYYSMGVYAELYFNKQVKYDITFYGDNINGVRNDKHNRNFELINMARES